MRSLSPSPTDSPGWPRAWRRAVLLALVCGALQAWQPAYTLGPLPLVPIGLTLGVIVAAMLARGPGALAGALLGALAGSVLAHGWPPGTAVLLTALPHTLLLGLQAGLALWWVRRGGDAGVLQLDTSARLTRLGTAAALAAALGALGGLGRAALAGQPDEWLSAAPWAHAFGRLVADWAGIVVVCAVLLCWLGRPIQPWRPRRRLVAWPLLLGLLVMLPGMDQVARRDDRRLEVRFDQEATARQRQLQQLLAEPVAAVAAARGILAAGGPGLSTSLFDGLAAGWTQRLTGLRALGWLEVTGSSAPQITLVHAHQAAAGALAALDGEARPRDGRETRAGRTMVLAEPAQHAVARALAADAPATARLGAGGYQAEGLVVVVQVVPGEAAGRKRVAFALVDLQRQLDSALPDANDLNLRVCVYDRGIPDARTGSMAGTSDLPVVLAGPPACARAAALGAFHTHNGLLTLSDRSLALLSVEPPTADNRLFTAVWLLGLPSVAGLALLATLLLAITGRMRRIEDRVHERTAALQSEIDERRQTQRALAQSEQRFRAIFESVNIGVTLVDGDGLIQMANPAFCTLMGCAADALVGRPLAEFKLPDVAEDDGTAEALGGARARRQRYITPDGRVLQVAASLRTLHDGSGEPVGTVGVLQDLTQMLRLREAERERDEAAVANRTKSEFLAQLSHELRAPLNAIVAFAQMVDDTEGPVEASPRLQRTLDNIRRAGWHLLDMVNDVLDLSRMEAGTLRLALGPVRLPEVAQEAMTMLEAAAGQAGVELTLSLSPQAEWVQADALRLRQVLVNLLGNAVKYNRRGGRVALRTRPAGVGELLIEVEDTGVGIAPDQIEALFRPFHRLGRQRDPVPAALHEQGTGIGLVICRKLATLMGGELEVSSTVGQGSVFGLRLPRASGPDQARSEVQAASPLASQVSIGQVLYIEDDPADVATMRSLLAARPGITLRAVGTAAEGLAQAADAELVLLDLDLPDAPGLDLLQALRSNSRWRQLPVIVVSAETRPDRIDACFDAGATAFFSKPLDAAPLLRAVDDALQQRL